MSLVNKIINKLIEHRILRLLGVSKGKRRGQNEYRKGSIRIRKK